MLAREFGGKAINKINMHNWRREGFAEWRRSQEAQKMIVKLRADGHQFSEATGGPVADVLATWVAARYAVGMKKLEGQGGDRAAAWNQLRECCHDVVALRRGEYLARRLELEHTRRALRFEKPGLEKLKAE